MFEISCVLKIKIKQRWDTSFFWTLYRPSLPPIYFLTKRKRVTQIWSHRVWWWKSCSHMVADWGTAGCRPAAPPRSFFTSFFPLSSCSVHSELKYSLCLTEWTKNMHILLLLVRNTTRINCTSLINPSLLCVSVLLLIIKKNSNLTNPAFQVATY